MSLSASLTSVIPLAQPVATATLQETEHCSGRGLSWLGTEQQADGSWLCATGAPE